MEQKEWDDCKELPLDEEEVGMSLVPIPAQTMIDVDKSVEAWEAYQELCRRILDDTDYAEIRGVKARKRSGWAKLRRFYGISTRIIEEIRVPPLAEWEPGQAFLYKFTVAAWLGNRVEHGDGACESEEVAGSSIAPTEHNVRAKALTRAKNRVTSDLIGGGEVSAEELDNGTASPPTKGKKGKANHWAENKQDLKRFRTWAHETLGLTDKQVLEALGVEDLKDAPPSTKETRRVIEEWVAEQIEEEREEEDGK